MTLKFLWRTLLIAALSVALAKPLHAGQLQTDENDLVIGIVVVSAAIAALVVILVLRHHKPKDKTITGCVDSGAGGMTVTSEKDKRRYSLSGNTSGIKQGDRVALVGKASGPGNAPVFEVQKVARDFGACQH
jgi:hypothetical protein